MMRLQERSTLTRDPTSPRQISQGLSRNRRTQTYRGIPDVEALLDLQRTRGNAFVQRLVQRRLAVGTEKASGQELWPFARRQYTDIEGKSNVGPLV